MAQRRSSGRRAAERSRRARRPVDPRRAPTRARSRPRARAGKRAASASSTKRSHAARPGRAPRRSSHQARRRRQEGRPGARAASRRRRRPPRPRRAPPRRPRARRASRQRRVAELREALRKNLIKPMDMVHAHAASGSRRRSATRSSSGRMTAEDAPGSPPAWSSAGASRPTTCCRTSSSCSAAAADEIDGAHLGRAQGGRAAPRRARKQAEGARRPCRARSVDRRWRRSTGHGARPAWGRASRSPGYDDLTAAQIQGPPRHADPGPAAQGARLRAPQRQPQDGAERDRVEAGLGTAAGEPRRAGR